MSTYHLHQSQRRTTLWTVLFITAFQFSASVSHAQDNEAPNSTATNDGTPDTGTSTAPQEQPKKDGEVKCGDQNPDLLWNGFGGIHLPNPTTSGCILRVIDLEFVSVDCGCGVGEGDMQTFTQDFSGSTDLGKDLMDLCEAKRHEICGDYRKGEEVRCKNKYGRCRVRSSGRVGSRVDTRYNVDCECNAGAKWDVLQQIDDYIEWDESSAREGCFAELARCQNPEASTTKTSFPWPNHPSSVVRTEADFGSGRCVFEKSPKKQGTKVCLCADNSIPDVSESAPEFPIGTPRETLESAFEFLRRCTHSDTEDNSSTDTSPGDLGTSGSEKTET